MNTIRTNPAIYANEPLAGGEGYPQGLYFNTFRVHQEVGRKPLQFAIAPSPARNIRKCT